MIPQRTLSNDFSGHEVRERVTACRKRLRVSRFMHKPASGGQLIADLCAPEASFLDAEPAMRESFRSTELHSPSLSGSNITHETLLDSQEVGIT